MGRTVFLVCLFLCLVSGYQASSTPSVGRDHKKEEFRNVRGSLIGVNLKKRTFSIDLGGGEVRTFSFTLDTKITKDGVGAFMSDMLAGDAVEVEYQSRGKRMVATTVRAESSRLLKMYRSPSILGY